MKRFFITFRVTLILFFSLVSFGLARAEPATRYPIVISNIEDLRAAGIAFSWREQTVKEFNNQCYYYGDGGHNLSFSDELVSDYVSKGFSLHSLCLAIVSEARFDPETGMRLPTFVVMEEAEFKSVFKGKNISKLKTIEIEELAGDLVSTELPLQVPSCFKGGTPYSDCNWRFDIISGSKLKEGTRESYKKLDKAFAAAISAHPGWQDCDDSLAVEDQRIYCIAERWGERDASEDGELIVKRLAPEGYGISDLFVDEEGKRLPGSLLSERDLELSHASFFDISRILPNGYGYALNADGGAGPAASVATIIAAHDGSKPGRQISSKRLKELIGN